MGSIISKCDTLAVDRPVGATEHFISAVVYCKYCDIERISSYYISFLPELSEYPATNISTEWQTQKYQILIVVRLYWEMSCSVKWIIMNKVFFL